jgi:hypothetical protein
MVDRYPKCGGKSVLCPATLKSDFDALDLPTPFWGLCNSIRCPVGMEPGSAWFLVKRADGDALAANSFHALTWYEGTSVTATFPKYVLHRAVLVGNDGDSKSPYLLEFRDKRQVLKMATVDKEYNVRRTTRFSDSATTDLYYTDSQNAGSDWTWQTMFDDLWGNLPSAIRGTAPTLATSGYVPTNEPENFRFHGSAWEAIGVVLEATHNVLCYDPIGDTFTVQRLGAEQSSLTSQETALVTAKRLLTTATPRTDLNLSVAPETIRVFFPKRMELDFQLAETAAGGALVDPYHTIDKTTSLTGAQAGAVMPFRTRFIAEVDEDGSTINNSSTLDTLAGEIRDKIVDRINRGTERGRKVYSGIVTTIKPGCEIHEMIWRDYGDKDGLVTEAWRKPELGMPKQAEQIQPFAPFTGEIWVDNNSGGNYSANGGPSTYRVLKGDRGSGGATSQTISAYNVPAFNSTKKGTAAVMNGTWCVSPQET